MGKIEKIEKLAGKGKVEKVLKFVGDKDKEVRAQRVEICNVQTLNYGMISMHLPICRTFPKHPSDPRPLLYTMHLAGNTTDSTWLSFLELRVRITRKM